MLPVNRRGGGAGSRDVRYGDVPVAKQREEGEEGREEKEEKEASFRELMENSRCCEHHRSEHRGADLPGRSYVPTRSPPKTQFPEMKHFFYQQQ